MTAVELFAAHRGGHCAPPSPVTLFFRRVLRMARRERAVPEIPSPASGAAAHFTLSDAMDTGEFPALDAKVDAVLRRPVNGRNLGTQPRRHPELPETFDNRPGRDVLERVLDGLRAMPVEATSRGGWQ